MKLFLSALFTSLLLSSTPCYAIFEFSSTYSYKKTFYGEDTYDISQSASLGLSYYFWEMSAIELAYTNGTGLHVQPQYSAIQNLTAYGAYLMLTLAGKDNPLQPYLKLGAAYIIKDITFQVPRVDPIKTKKEGLSPSAGAGLKLMLSKTFGIRAGFDVTASPLNSNEVTYDFNGTAGVSILF